MSKWLNTKKILLPPYKNPKDKAEKLWNEFYRDLNNAKLKPCHFCGFCPYGSLIEAFPITIKRTKYSCKVFGHNCPVFYHAEPLAEELKK